MTVTIPQPKRDSPARARARERLARVIWTPTGERRLPRERELVHALSACTREHEDDVWWTCETSSAGPVYLLPTREWLSALARFVSSSGARTVLEVGAGDGFLARCLREARPQLRVIATDTHAWARASARMNARDSRVMRNVSLAGIPRHDDVVRMSATRAVREHRPDLVIVSWPPPGPLVAKLIRAQTKLVLEIGADGDVCGDPRATWRYHKELLDGPLETRALCRLDARPRESRATRVTMYYGKRHRQHGVDAAALLP